MLYQLSYSRHLVEKTADSIANFAAVFNGKLHQNVIGQPPWAKSVRWRVARVGGDGMCGACGGEARPVSGGRGSCASACCALRHGGSAIGRLPSPPAASASMRFRFGLALRFRKPAALPRGLVASVRSARSSRSSARVRVPPPDAWLASAGRMRRDAVVSRRPARASAAPSAAGGARAPSQSSRTARPAAPRLRASPIARCLRNHGAEKFGSLILMARTNIEELLRIEFSLRLGDRVDAAVLRQGGGTPPQGRRKR